MRRTLVLFLSLCSFFIKAQDSLRPYFISAVQLDLAPPVLPNYRELTQQDYQKIAKDDPFVNADLKDYRRAGWMSYAGMFNAMAGVKVYASLKSKRPISKELFIGLKYSQESNFGTYYEKETFDTIGVYTNTYDESRLYEIRWTRSSYQYQIRSDKFLLPLGINWCTNKKKLFWITFGVELTPVLNFNYKLLTTHGVEYIDRAYHEGDSLYSSSYYAIHTPDSKGYGVQRLNDLKGIGYGLYASLPFTLYFHPFRETKFLKHINILGSICPLYVYAYSRFTGSVSELGASVSTGIRINW